MWIEQLMEEEAVGANLLQTVFRDSKAKVSHCHDSLVFPFTEAREGERDQ